MINLSRQQLIVLGFVALILILLLGFSMGMAVAKRPAVAIGEAEPEDVLTSKTFSNAGAVGITGTMPDNGAVVITPTTTNRAIVAGYHNGSGYVVGDANLVAGNIASGVDIFGVTGSAVVATGDATAGDVLTDTTFSNASQAGIAGTMPDNGAVVITPTTTNRAIVAGYHNGSGYVEGDSNLVPSNLRAGVTIFGVTGTVPEAPIPKTGQTTSHDTGDDGDLEKGVAWPTPRFTDNSDGTVTDNLTGLIWLKNASCANVKENQATAHGHVAQLNTDGTMNSSDCDDTSNGGSHQTDWRLPNVRELHSLIDYGRYNPALPSVHPFTGVRSDYYWSSTTYPGSTSPAWAWLVNMSDGQVLTSLNTNPGYVWPVRGGQ
jgi:hypothetical protein